MMDFTIKTYQTLLEALIKQGFSFQTFQEFLERPDPLPCRLPDGSQGRQALGPDSYRDKGEREKRDGIQKFRTTFDIIKAAEKGELPDKIMFTSRGWFTFHPQRWTDKPAAWAKELVLQNAKNVVKYFLVKRNIPLINKFLQN